MPRRNGPPDIIIEHAQLKFCNFSGREERFNPSGTRKFSIVLPEEVARDLERQGYNPRWPKDNPDLEEGEEDTRQPTIPVIVKYSFKPPKVTMVTSNNEILLDEETIHVLDQVDIAEADVLAVPHWWEMGDKSGWNPYLKNMYVTIDEDPLDRKWAQIRAQRQGSDE